MLRHQTALEAIGKPRNDTLQARKLAIKIGPQTVEFFRIAKLIRLDNLIKPLGIGLVVKAIGDVGPGPVWADRHHAFLTLVARFAFRHFLFRGHFGFSIALLIAFGLLTSHFG